MKPTFTEESGPFPSRETIEKAEAMLIEAHSGKLHIGAKATPYLIDEAGQWDSRSLERQKHDEELFDAVSKKYERKLLFGMDPISPDSESKGSLPSKNTR